MAIATLALGVAACAGPRLRYETTVIRTKPVTESQRSDLVHGLEEALGARQVLSQSEGQPSLVHPQGSGLASLDLSALRAAYAVMEETYFGAEVDILITHSNQTREAVNAWVDVEGAITLRRAGRSPGNPRDLGAQGLTSRFGVGALQEAGKAWNQRSRGALALALARLSPNELAVLARIPFVRAPRSPETVEGGRYYQRNCHAVIYVFDRAFLGAHHQFVGSPTAPLPAAVRTILHEVGHALHHRPGREAFCRYEDLHARRKDRVSRLNTAVSRHNDLARRFNAGERAPAIRAEVGGLQRQIEAYGDEVDALDHAIAGAEERAVTLMEEGPVLAAYALALDGEDAPTRYGENNLKESFAESFALFRADPDALKRVLPAVHRWFVDGGHEKALVSPPES